MTTSVCFYFQIHQPFRLKKDYNFFCIGEKHLYEDYEANRQIMMKVANKCYLPTNKIMLDHIKKYNGKFRIAYSISGLAIEQFEMYAPEVLDSFKQLVDTGCVELINETYYHSLAFVKSREEFREQVKAHREKIQSLFGVTPTTFRNTELIYNNDLAREVENLGFDVILAEGAESALGWRTPNFVYRPIGTKKLKLLMKNYKLSDDVAFRFSNKTWKEYPLTPDKYALWLHQVAGVGQTINLFMDYETFGEHQWAESGIFDFLRALPDSVFKHPDFVFQTPSEVAALNKSMGDIDVPHTISWADVDRDLSAWMGNSMQQSAIDLAYSLEKPVKATKDTKLIHTWRKLLSSDHSYYASTKGFGDGAVHSYFSPYKTPYDAYLSYVNVLNDLKLTVEDRIQ